MKKYLLSFMIVFFSFQSFSQLLSWPPDFPTESTTSFTITMNANYGYRNESFFWLIIYGSVVLEFYYQYAHKK